MPSLWTRCYAALPWQACADVAARQPTPAQVHDVGAAEPLHIPCAVSTGLDLLLHDSRPK